MSQPPPRSPVESFAAYMARLVFAVEALRANYRLRVPGETIGLVILRLHAILQRVRRLAEAVAAGTYRPRTAAKPPRKAPAERGPQPGQAPETPGPERTESVFRKRGWLSPLLPEVANQYRGGLLHQLQTPEMVALIEAAPAEMKRTLRPLFWALGFRPPPILALPKPPREPRPPKAKRKRRRPARPLGTMPDWMRVRIPSAEWPPGVEDPLPEKSASKKFG